MRESMDLMDSKTERRANIRTKMTNMASEPFQ